MKRALVLILAGLVLSELGMVLAQTTNQGSKDIPPDIVQIMKKHCATCHTGQRPPKGLSLIPSKIASAINAPSVEMPQLKLIDTANPEAGYMLKKILGAEDIKDAKMPRGKHMPEAELETLKAWILGLKAK